jgi:hypothetical protein
MCSYKRKPAAPASTAIPAPATFIAPPVNCGSVLVDVAFNMSDGTIYVEVVLRLADRIAEVVARLAVLVLTKDCVLVTWTRELGVESTGVKAVTLERGTDGVGRIVRLVSRISETVSE